jgi:predicted amidophosphoribosyltransferase
MRCQNQDCLCSDKFAKPSKEGAKYCWLCGTALGAKEMSTTCSCGKKYDQYDRFCTKCGEERQ